MAGRVRNFLRGPGLLFLVALPATPIMVWLMQRAHPWVWSWLMFWLACGLVVGVAEVVSGRGVGGRGEPLPEANAESARFMAGIVGVTALTSLVAAADHDVSLKFPLRAMAVGLMPYLAIVCLAGQIRIKRRW